MKLVLNLFLFLFALFILEGNSFSLTNYQISQICRKEKRRSICIRNLKEKLTNLQNGNLIEIPVINYKK